MRIKELRKALKKAEKTVGNVKVIIAPEMLVDGWPCDVDGVDTVYTDGGKVARVELW